MSDTTSLNYINNNKVFIYGRFDDTILTDVIPHFYSLIEEQAKNKEGKITISINSGGGVINVLNTLLSLVEQAKTKGIIVETIVESDALSCASTLAISGSKGHRYITPWGHHLVHFGRMGVPVHSEAELDKTHDYFKKQSEFSKERYVYYTSLSLEQVNKLKEHDYSFLYAQECIDFGLADQMLGDPSMLEQKRSKILD